MAEPQLLADSIGRFLDVLEARGLRGTASMPAAHYYRTPHWRSVRAEVLERDGQRCQRCGSAGPLVVHHKTYDRLWAELLADLITLCEDCHRCHHRRHPAPKDPRDDEQVARHALSETRRRHPSAMTLVPDRCPFDGTDLTDDDGDSWPYCPVCGYEPDE
jgi:hypothetical protein